MKRLLCLLGFHYRLSDTYGLCADCGRWML